MQACEVAMEALFELAFAQLPLYLLFLIYLNFLYQRYTTDFLYLYSLFYHGLLNSASTNLNFFFR